MIINNHYTVINHFPPNNFLSHISCQSRFQNLLTPTNKNTHSLQTPHTISHASDVCYHTGQTPTLHQTPCLTWADALTSSQTSACNSTSCSPLSSHRLHPSIRIVVRVSVGYSLLQSSWRVWTGLFYFTVGNIRVILLWVAYVLFYCGLHTCYFTVGCIRVILLWIAL